MPAKYVLTQKGKSFHWSLLATNGRVIASSEVYNTKAAAMAGIRSVQKNGPTDVVVTADELADSRAATKRPAKRASGSGTAARTTTAKKTSRTSASSGTASSAPARKTASRSTAKATSARKPAKKAATGGTARRAATKRSPAKKASS